MYPQLSKLIKITAVWLVLYTLITTAVAGNNTPQAGIASEKDLQGLLNWAVHLSRYDKPDQLPDVQFVDHRFLVRRACYGKECNVLGWYNDNNIVYIDSKLAALDSMMERSIVVHEMVHYLQHQAKTYGTSCKESLLREFEAYEIQRQFFFAYGALSPIVQKEFHCVELPEQQLSAGEDF